MSLGVGELMQVAWRLNTHAPARVEVIPSNYGTAGSRADVRRRRTDVILPSTDPRQNLWNGLIPVAWRTRTDNQGRVTAVAARAPQTLGRPMNFTAPRVASLTPRPPR